WRRDDDKVRDPRRLRGQERRRLHYGAASVLGAEGGREGFGGSEVRDCACKTSQHLRAAFWQIWFTRSGKKLAKARVACIRAVLPAQWGMRAAGPWPSLLGC